MGTEIMTTDVVATKTTTALAVVTASITEINAFEAEIAELEKQYAKVVYDVKDKKGMEAAKKARADIRKPRYALQNLQKDAKRPLNNLKEAIDSQSEALISRASAVEDPIQEQIENEETRLHDEAVARETAERERVEMLEARLASISTMPYEATGLSSKEVTAILADAKSITLGDDWQEFKEKATAAKITTIASLEGVLAKAIAGEAETARIIAERAELEKLRAENAKRDAEAKRLQEAETARVAAEQKAKMEKLLAIRAELDRVEQERQAAAKAEQDKLDSDRREFAEMQAKAEAEQKERIRLDNVGFRAHQDHLSPAQRDQLLALSNASPNVDVYSLVLPVVEAPIVLIDEPRDVFVPRVPVIEHVRPSDAEIVQCVCERFEVDIDTAEEWLADFANRNLSECAA